MFYRYIDTFFYKDGNGLQSVTSENRARCIAIAAGKGGVGKSSISVNLALALVASGAEVGILDADLYGPSIGKMLPKTQEIQEVEGWMIPAQGLGIHYISLSHFPLGKQATIVRAPIANQLICEFLHHVRWPKLDFLLIDFPPGTGDIQLTLMQQASLAGAILVTTPQEVALLDVQKAYEMFQEMQVPVFGVIENMSYFEEYGFSQRFYPFGQGGGRSFCKKLDLKLLGEVPLDPQISSCCDQSLSLLEKFPGSEAALVFEKIARELQLSTLQDHIDMQKMVGGFELIWDEGKS